MRRLLPCIKKEFYGVWLEMTEHDDDQCNCDCYSCSGGDGNHIPTYDRPYQTRLFELIKLVNERMVRLYEMLLVEMERAVSEQDKIQQQVLKAQINMLKYVLESSKK